MNKHENTLQIQEIAKLSQEGHLLLCSRVEDESVVTGQRDYTDFYVSAINALDGIENCAFIEITVDAEQKVLVLVLIPEEKTVDEKEFRKKISHELIVALDGYTQPDAILVRDHLPLKEERSSIDHTTLEREVFRDFQVKALIKARSKG